jgi:hypothetical protein
VAAPLLAVLSGVLLPFEPPYRSVANPPAVPALEDLLVAVAAMTVIVTGLGMLVAAWSLLVRFGGAHGVERQRLRWVALAAVLTVVVVPVPSSVVRLLAALGDDQGDGGARPHLASSLLGGLEGRSLRRRGRRLDGGGAGREPARQPAHNLCHPAS